MDAKLRARLQEDVMFLKAGGGHELRKIGMRIEQMLEQTEAASRVIEGIEIDLPARGECESPSCLIWSHIAQLLRQDGFAKGPVFDAHFKGTSLESKEASSA